MQSYHNDIGIKEKYISRIRDQIDSGGLIRRGAWEKGKLAANVCIVEDLHIYESELGIPKWVARLGYNLFDSMSPDYYPEWIVLFFESIPIGVNEHRLISEIKAPFALDLALAMDKSKKEIWCAGLAAAWAIDCEVESVIRASAYALGGFQDEKIYRLRYDQCADKLIELLKGL